MPATWEQAPGSPPVRLLSGPGVGAWPKDGDSVSDTGCAIGSTRWAVFHPVMDLLVQINPARDKFFEEHLFRQHEVILYGTFTPPRSRRNQCHRPRQTETTRPTKTCGEKVLLNHFFHRFDGASPQPGTGGSPRSARSPWAVTAAGDTSGYGYGCGACIRGTGKPSRLLNPRTTPGGRRGGPRGCGRAPAASRGGAGRPLGHLTAPPPPFCRGVEM